MPKRVHIIGRKNSGKTTLIAELVQHLTGRGYRVCTIKHTDHHHELDTPGKDSHRHREAGVAVVGILAPQMNAVFWRLAQIKDKLKRYAAMMPMYQDCDLILVEGDSQTDARKIEVWRAANDAEPLAAKNRSISTVVTDDPVDVSIPVRSRSDVPALLLELIGSEKRFA